MLSAREKQIIELTIKQVLAEVLNSDNKNVTQFGGLREVDSSELTPMQQRDNNWKNILK